MKQFIMIVWIMLIVIGFNSITFAKEDLGQARLFLGSTPIKPTKLNTELTTQGIKNLELLNQFGVEITFPTFKVLQTGLRYTRHYAHQDELVSNDVTNYRAEITQDSMMGIVRYPFFKRDHVLIDIFLGAGAGTTTYSQRDATKDGKLTNSGSLVYAGGASLAVGYDKYFLFFETGYEGNKVGKFKKSEDSFNSTIESLDMSGTYFTIGLMFDGIPIFTK